MQTKNFKAFLYLSSHPYILQPKFLQKKGAKYFCVRRIGLKTVKRSFFSDEGLSKNDVEYGIDGIDK
jgi:hypothetical protein